jgi:hypothetical protein
MERAVLAKIMYKNRNQHRGSVVYDKIKHVEKLSKILEVEMSRHYDPSEGQWVSFLQGLRTASKPSSSEHERVVPLAESGLSMLEIALKNCQIAEKLSKACYLAAKSCSGQLAHSFFMPLSIMCLAVVSRMQVLAAQILVKCSREYNSLVELIEYLPWSGEVANIECSLPRMVHCRIEKGMIPVMRQIKQVDQESWWKECSEQRADGLPHGCQAIPGLQPLQDKRSFPHSQEDVDFSSKLNVMEDRGQPISREEMLGMVCSEDLLNQVVAGDGVLPAFDVDEISETPLVDKQVIEVPQREKTLKILQPESVIVTKQCVPSLPKRDTAFVRIGDSTQVMGFDPPRDKEKKSNTLPVVSSVPEKSWEDWIGRPSAPSTRAPDGPQFGSKKRKKRKTKHHPC